MTESDSEPPESDDSLEAGPMTPEGPAPEDPVPEDPVPEDTVTQEDPVTPDELAILLADHRVGLLAFIDGRMGIALRRRVEANDVFQEMSVEALRRANEGNLVLPEPFPWLCILAERRVIDAYRRIFGAQKRDARRERGLEAAGTGDAAFLEVLAQTMTTPSQAFARNERQHELHRALESLAEVPREAIRLRYVEGLPTKEIAQLLDKSDGAIRVLLTRTLRELQESIGGDFAP